LCTPRARSYARVASERARRPARGITEVVITGSGVTNGVEIHGRTGADPK
jgi:hypothetical protein